MLSIVSATVHLYGILALEQLLIVSIMLIVPTWNSQICDGAEIVPRFLAVFFHPQHAVSVLDPSHGTLSSVLAVLPGFALVPICSFDPKSEA